MVELTPRGTLLLYDNGNFRAMPPKKRMDVSESYSRAVEYAIDAKAMTAAQVWRYGGKGQEHFYSPFISEADSLPNTGNILITDGGRLRDKQGRQSELIIGDRHWARVIEVTHADPPQKVFELTVDTGADGSMGWAIYRSDRLSGLY
ncbi:MAG: aryl-sulfate sulfotransferase [Bryobacterales bacterium]